jgi:hypothetical protein
LVYESSNISIFLFLKLHQRKRIAHLVKRRRRMTER